LTAKKRVYDLAKEYGMTGQELAARLLGLGFTQIKSHMTALSEFEVLEIQARLEAYGIVGESRGEKNVATVGGLKIKRKKKLPTAEPDEAPTEEEPPPPAAPAAAPPPPPPEAVHEEVEAEAEVDEPLVPEPPEPEPVLDGTSEPELEVAAEADEAEAALAPEPPLAAAPETEATPAAPGAPAGATPAAAPAAGTDDELVRPAARRRSGKVVGFIDPSQFERKDKPRPESRRLRSSDEEVPDVMPTMGRDRKPGVVRGDTTRGAMTNQELREREAGRFLRRRRVTPTGPGTSVAPGMRRGPAPVKGPDAAGGSPFSGGTVEIEAPVTLKKLANTLAVKENEVLKVALRQVGLGINVNSVIDVETAMLLSQEFGVQLSVSEAVAAETQLLDELREARQAVETEALALRPPTVAILGHVDHGKTTLIDTIRKSRIAEGESGGITQHIGAYQVKTQAGHTLTIVDTPGHAAFTSMRARGAKAVDIVVLVVAADDGVKPQTEEALNHARAASVPIVVALNKVDKKEANPDRVRNELSKLGLVPEQWGGTTAMLELSALKNQGVEELLERVFLESEVLELRSHLEGPASGVVLEAEIQQGKGKIAHLLVQDGVLRKGDVILAGEGYGKVRSIHDDRGRSLPEAGPSMPVEVTGLNELPTVGDKFYVVDSLDRAAEVSSERARANRQLAELERRPVFHENILQAVAERDKPTIALIVKADMQGSVEVLKHQIAELKHDEMQVKLVHAGVGAVLESDVDLAITSGCRILAFHTTATPDARQKAERAGIDIKVYTVIYELLDDVKRLMEGELAPEVKEEVTGHAEVRRVFKSSKFGNIAGCFVLDGKIARSSKVRLLRDSQVVFTGEIGSLRREKDDTKEVKEGFECGILLKDYNDVREQDVIEAFRMFEVKRTL
jgi:translation initiation factor IF-2